MVCPTKARFQGLWQIWPEMCLGDDALTILALLLTALLWVKGIARPSPLSAHNLAPVSSGLELRIQVQQGERKHYY